MLLPYSCLVAKTRNFFFIIVYNNSDCRNEIFKPRFVKVFDQDENGVLTVFLYTY